jgi:mRNA-degrading endonuclease RelE of RelBE toxin-antitoxin system
MIYRIDFDGEVAQILRHLHPQQKSKIKMALKSLSRDPFLGKPLEDELRGFYSFRLGRLRVIYKFFKQKRHLHIVVIGPRSTIYDNLAQELLKEKK